MLTIASLHIGQTAVIKEFPVDLVPLKLLEMGCLPGNKVSLVHTAPYQDPIYLNVNGCHLAIRLETAAKIEIELLD